MPGKPAFKNWKTEQKQQKWERQEKNISSTQRTTAMIMAAGLGTRMAPLTDHQPKALVSLAGRPLISYLLEALATAGFLRVLINLHAHADVFRAYLNTCESYGLEIILSDETEQLMETGGGLRQALPLLTKSPCQQPDSILIVNVDAIYLEASPGSIFRQLGLLWKKLEKSGQKQGALLALSHLENVIGYQGKGDFQPLILSEKNQKAKWQPSKQMTLQSDAPFLIMRSFQPDSSKEERNPENMKIQESPENLSTKNEKKKERPEKNRPDKNRPDKNRPDKNRPEKNRPEKNREAFVYAGSQIIALKNLETYPLEPFSLNRIWNDMLLQDRLYGTLLENTKFLHVGDPDARKQAEQAISLL